jgi:hypothetical protein
MSSIGSEDPTEGKGTYDVLFIGLICFLKGDREALMPDGRTPPDGVAPHNPYIVVDPSSITGRRGWETTDPQSIAFMERGIFTLPKCRVEMTRATEVGKLNASHHDKFVPKLIDSDPNVRVDPRTARTVVRIKIGSGTLEALRTPTAEPEDDDVAIITRLRVEHGGPIVVTVHGEGEKDPRILELAAGTDIALANVAFPHSTVDTGDHFQIYGRLTVKGEIGTPRRVAPRVPRLEPTHTIFGLGIPISDGKTPCGTQGCCPP